MIYILKLLCVVLATGGLAHYLLRGAFTGLLAPHEYRRAWALLLCATVLVYLARFAGAYALGLALVALLGVRDAADPVRARLAVFSLLLVSLPPVHLIVGGVAGVTYVLDFTHTRILSLVLLLGACITLAGRSRRDDPRRFLWLDLAVVAYPLFKLALVAPSLSLTTVARSLLETGLDVILPWYALSRGLRSRDDFRLVMGYLALGLLAVASVASVEALLQHNLYSGLQSWYDINWQLTYKLMRGAFLRVQATTPQPIILAFEMVFGIGLWAALHGREWRRPGVLAGFALLTSALVFSWSRGPWLSGAVLLLCLVASVRLPRTAFRVLLIAPVIAGVALQLSGLDDQLFGALRDLLGDTDTRGSSIDYRRELLDTALALLRQSPWLGVPNYAAHMENLRQGEGIIDLVNTYVRVALDTGVVGLVLFLWPFILVMCRLLAAQGRAVRADDPDRLVAPAFLATLVGLLAAILTTSVWFVMPQILLLSLVLPAAWLRLQPVEPSAAARQPRRAGAAA